LDWLTTRKQKLNEEGTVARMRDRMMNSAAIRVAVTGDAGTEKSRRLAFAVTLKKGSPGQAGADAARTSDLQEPVWESEALRRRVRAANRMAGGRLHREEMVEQASADLAKAEQVDAANLDAKRFQRAEYQGELPCHHWVRPAL
jgi:hypothetical protein